MCHRMCNSYYIAPSELLYITHDRHKRDMRKDMYRGERESFLP